MLLLILLLLLPFLLLSLLLLLLIMLIMRTVLMVMLLVVSSKALTAKCTNVLRSRCGLAWLSLPQTGKQIAPYSDATCVRNDMAILGSNVAVWLQMNILLLSRTLTFLLPSHKPYSPSLCLCSSPLTLPSSHVRSLTLVSMPSAAAGGIYIYIYRYYSVSTFCAVSVCEKGYQKLRPTRTGQS